MAILSTASTGKLIREEVEIPIGSTLIFTHDYPIGVTGWEFVANFRHELGAETGTGGFTITPLTETLIGLRSGSDGLPAGRYVWDIRATNTATGEVSITSPRDFRLVDSITGSQGGQLPDPPTNVLENLVNSLIDVHNLNPSAHPNAPIGGGTGSYSFEVDEADLIGSYLIVEHNFNQLVVDVTLFDDEGPIAVDYTPLTVNSVQVNFDGLIPFTKTYTILIEK